MQRSDYRSTFAISQSAIKEFRYKSPKRWKEIWIEKQLDLDKNEEAFTFGSLVDTILFTPHLIEDRFYIADVSKIPTGTTEKIVSYVYENSTPAKYKVTVDDDMLPEPTVKWEYDFASLQDTILEACDKYEWNSKWKPDTRVNKIIEAGKEYFNLLVEAQGRKVITSEVNFEALNLVRKLRTDKNVKKYFVDTNTSRNIFQLELFDKHISNDHYEVPVKCAIDILHIDEENHTLRICDFKTSHSAFNFIQSIKQYGYCDQLSFYNFMLEKALEKDIFLEQIGLDSTVRWTVLEPINVVIDEQDKIPYLYEYDRKDIAIAQQGNSEYLYNVFQTRDHSAKVKKGWMELLEEICWHIQNDSWDYPVEYYKTGKLKVNLTNA
jgi:hypothetical protein